MPRPVLRRLRKGVVIPAHPLALSARRRLDERRQRALTRYYMAAGAGGVAVGVHTTQFEIRDPKIGLFQPVLELAAETMKAEESKYEAGFIRIAGICGDTGQAVKEAATAADLGYHAGLLSLGAMATASVDELVKHAAEVAKVIPVFGFYLQPSVGGRILPYEFWRRFAEIDNVVAIKIAPFNRYQTLDVVRAVKEAGRAKDIALYTGNDDTIIADLLTTFRFSQRKGAAGLRIVGGLLGHWAFWTRRAVLQLEECHRLIVVQKLPIPQSMLTLGAQVTDANAAAFDPRHQFAGCIPGIHEILRRQGLLEGLWCLNPKETLSPGQLDEIDRVHKAYPQLNDDAFVAHHLDDWLR
ncbi:MAG TPA: dihydrodipicolinate synthase family protein [Bryobacterales bacterium]|nr:dihydrodipicolinate synthase family protein [Bryobacterales bacterium]